MIVVLLLMMDALSARPAARLHHVTTQSVSLAAPIMFHTTNALVSCYFILSELIRSHSDISIVSLTR